MFDTPVGGAALLGLIFSAILLYILYLLIREGIDFFFNPQDRQRTIYDDARERGAEAIYNDYLSSYGEYLTTGTFPGQDKPGRRIYDTFKPMFHPWDTYVRYFNGPKAPCLHYRPKPYQLERERFFRRLEEQGRKLEPWPVPKVEIDDTLVYPSEEITLEIDSPD
jgi:hypothetical protein